MASFLETFQNKTPSAADSGDKNLGSVLSALNRAEAIGKMSASNRGGSDAPTGASGIGNDLMLRLQQQQRASALSRSHLLEEAMRITNAGDLSASGGSASTPTAASSGNEELIQQLLRQQQQTQQQQQEPNAMIAAAMREMAQKRAVQQLMNADGGSGVNNQLLSRLLEQQQQQQSGTGTDFMLEKLRLEEGIHALMRERVRLEAAAILEDRERRRLEALVSNTNSGSS